MFGHLRREERRDRREARTLDRAARNELRHGDVAGAVALEAAANNKRRQANFVHAERMAVRGPGPMGGAMVGGAIAGVAFGPAAVGAGLAVGAVAGAVRAEQRAEQRAATNASMAQQQAIINAQRQQIAVQQAASMVQRACPFCQCTLNVSLAWPETRCGRCQGVFVPAKAPLPPSAYAPPPMAPPAYNPQY